MAVPPTADLIPWVCARAAANASLSQCKHCEWFKLPELAPLTTANDARLLATAECADRPRPVLAWFMCLTPATDALALGHLDYVKAAIVSARLNAPSLAPYVVLVCLLQHSLTTQCNATHAHAKSWKLMSTTNIHLRNRKQC